MALQQPHAIEQPHAADPQRHAVGLQPHAIGPQDHEAAYERELAIVRAQFNPASAGGWGIIFDRHAHRWTAVRGSRTIVHAGSASELRAKLTAGHWNLAAR
ncbi:hypothetical protein [Actinomadura sp. 3N508]|uniref:hypothetical protein n=1 Tax=Actinomadura sp. 3N508 TaxID=3375153 RepID=UPI00379FB4D0